MCKRAAQKVKEWGVLAGLTDAGANSRNALIHEGRMKKREKDEKCKVEEFHSVSLLWAARSLRRLRGPVCIIECLVRLRLLV